MDMDADAGRRGAPRSVPATFAPAVAILTAIAIPALASCGDSGTGIRDPAVDFRTSFEEDMSDFAPDTADTDDPPVEWSVERSTDDASDGEASVRIRIENLNDQTKVWIERAFRDLEPATRYRVELRFDFASADWGSVNLWTLFADADPQSPEDWSDFQDDAFTTDTGNGASEASGHLWDTRTTELEVETDAEGAIHVAIGVWGTYEVERSYFIDDVRVRLIRSTGAAVR